MPTSVHFYRPLIEGAPPPRLEDGSAGVDEVLDLDVRLQLARELGLYSLQLAQLEPRVGDREPRGRVAGMLLAIWLRGLLSVTVPENLTSELGMGTSGIGGGTVALTLGVGLACGLLVGLVAAWRAMKADPMTLLRRGSVGRGDRRLFDGAGASGDADRGVRALRA